MTKNKSRYLCIGKWVLVIYLLLLLLSHLISYYTPLTGKGLYDQKFTQLPTLKENNILSESVIMAYSDHNTHGEDAPVLVMLHGSPLASDFFTPLISELTRHYRLIIPDLPGFGGSSLKIPDYSSRTHARYVLALLEKLGIEKAHLLGYSQGSVVALNMIDLAGNHFTFSSLSMVSAIGVIELDLLGNYSINKALYSLQNGFFWLLQKGIPHFGWLDNKLFNYSYSRNFYDTDMRPLRGIIHTVECPVMIIHGKNDLIVSLATALEHHRILPQSELILFQGDHLLLSDQPQTCAKVLSDFIDKVEKRNATTRSSAVSERLIAAEEPFNGKQRVNKKQSLILLGLIALATWVTEDLSSITAGLLVANGSIPYFSALLACFLGIFSGDLILYGIGRFWGRKLIERPFFQKWISKEHLEQSEQWFQRKGALIIFTTRFIPGTRLPTYFTAGLARLPFFRFIVLFTLAISIWVPFLVTLSMFFGQQVMYSFNAYSKYALPTVIIAILLVYWGSKLLYSLFHYRGRRLLLSRWIRLTQWEFWPIWAQYFPIYFYICKLSIQYRLPTLPTATNPSVFAGGLIGESKASILKGLEKVNAPIPLWTVIKKNIPIAEGLNFFKAFLAQNNLDYPVVFKPDKGHRGQGVTIIRSIEDARAYLEKITMDTIVQEYLHGQEYGIFYYRYPNEENGKIFSINDKRFIYITGDGKSSLEKLILSHERAVSQASLHLRQNKKQLSRIPKEGEEIRLGDIGNHARGVQFFDRSDLLTTELSKVIDSMTIAYGEFYFGRYDIRVPSEEDLKAGKSIKIIELNGAAAESSNMYDPKYGYWDGLKILMQQWRIAFALGDQNRKRGFPPTPFKQVLMAFIKTRKKPLKK